MDSRELPVLTVPEAGARLGLGRSAAYSAAKRGELPVIRIGGRILVLRAPFERLLRGEPPPRTFQPEEADHAA